jgi:hypothetical protein
MTSAKKITKRAFEKALSDLLRELQSTHPWVLRTIIEGFMEDKGLSEDQAIRKLAKLETTLAQLLEASQSMGEA